ncbi:metalloprotease PmbA [Amphibiibacter pelophylacis]|uniref:Metalloprotease PmbA n=1 Tax=Amphibiibacter pelophylacis TaxID=1799477 RepID=A0ACC6P5L3_9BURK
MNDSRPDKALVFAHSREQFETLVDEALALALKTGATAASAGISEDIGLSVSVRMRDLENVERNHDRSFGLTVMVGQSQGHASTSDFSREAIARTVQAAYDIARFTASDEHAGLPELADLALDATQHRDLDLFHPWAIDADDAAQIALQCEAAALDFDKRITQSEGASVSAQQSHFVAGNTLGFRGAYASSRHSVSVAPIAGKGAQMQRDYWFDSMRDPADLATPDSIGRTAAQRALARLGSRKVATCEVPVLFDPMLSAGLIGSFVHAVSGGALYRQASFLQDSLGQAVFADHIDLLEDPFVPKGKASSPFDSEGVRVCARQVVDAGVVRGYFLASYSARKLGMANTGHGGGSHNLTLRSRLTQPGDDFAAMLRKMDRGLVVTELLGQGVNGVTGDYSRGAAGFWVEKGQIVHAVEEVTIAGNLKDMYRNIVAIGADAFTYGGKTSGSVLIGGMKVAGSA